MGGFTIKFVIIPEVVYTGYPSSIVIVRLSADGSIFWQTSVEMGLPPEHKKPC